MDIGIETLTVAGETLKSGTSLFNARTDRVMWYLGVRGENVYLETIDGGVEMPKHVFEDLLRSDDLVVEARPLGSTV